MSNDIKIAQFWLKNILKEVFNNKYMFDDEQFYLNRYA